MSSYVQVKGLSKTYPNGTEALRDVSFALDSGEFAVIVGKSGAGKSTLLRCMNSLTEPTGGEVEIDGRSVTGLSGNELRAARKEMGFVFQQFNLVKRISALNNVLCGMLSGMPTMRSVLRRFTNEERISALDCLEKVGLADKAHQRADTLSGGQMQRVAIARVLAQGPKVVLADEPVASLDPESARTVMDALRYLATEEGIAVFCNLHQVNLAGRYADRILGMRDGELVLDRRSGRLEQDEVRAVYGAAMEEAFA
jgi:phosphonate transport system ATP-binding protein